MENNYSMKKLFNQYERGQINFENLKKKIDYNLDNMVSDLNSSLSRLTPDSKKESPLVGIMNFNSINPNN